MIRSCFLLNRQVGDLTTCPSLIRLDLSQNAVQDTSFAATCQQIKWLSLANNPITDLGPLQRLTNLQAGFPCPKSFQACPVAKFELLCGVHILAIDIAWCLQVLNVGHAKLAGKIQLNGLDQLGALILNDNQITAVAGMSI